jgi:hypothetical protein
MAKLTRKQILDDLLDQLDRNGMVGAFCKDMVHL